MSNGKYSEAQIAAWFQESVRDYGIEHTHDIACRTWRGSNWMGACDCTLPAREVTP